MTRFQRGIALIQVLIISMVLSILGIYILQSSNDQINITNSIKTAFDLRVELEDAEASVLHALLTELRVKNKQSKNEVAKLWNFHNTRFEVGRVSVQIQDLNGLISLNMTDDNTLRDFLLQLGVSSGDAEQFIDSLADWKDDNDNHRLYGAERDYYESQGVIGPRNGYLQSVAEVYYIKKNDILTHEQWAKYFTVERVDGFNPANAPKEILQSFIKNDSKVANLVELRDNIQLNEYQFAKETGISSDEFLTFVTGNNLRITLIAKSEQQQIKKTFNVALRTRSLTRPIVITNVVWNKHEN